MTVKKSHRRSTSGACAVAGFLAAAVVLAGCGTETDSASEEPTTTPSESVASETPTETPSETASEAPAASSLVYFVVDTRAGLRLAREPRELSGESGAAAAVEAMIAGPEDPDYTSTWSPDTEVLGVTQEGDTIVVDLSEEARTANVGSPGAAAMIQQLVWTATEVVDPEATVQLTIAGQPAGELWGAVAWDEPIGRQAADEVRMFVGIDSLAEGAFVSSPVEVSGLANAFEATVPWQVLDEQGKKVEKGFTNAAEGMVFSEYSFTVELEPGTYTIEVSEDDPSGGEAGEPMSDSRTVTVE